MLFWNDGYPPGHVHSSPYYTPLRRIQVTIATLPSKEVETAIRYILISPIFSGNPGIGRRAGGIYKNVAATAGSLHRLIKICVYGTTRSCRHQSTVGWMKLQITGGNTNARWIVFPTRAQLPWSDLSAAAAAVAAAVFDAGRRRRLMSTGR